MGIFRDDMFEIGWPWSPGAERASAGGSPRPRGSGLDAAILSRKAEHLEPSAAAITGATGRRCLPLVADVRQPTRWTPPSPACWRSWADSTSWSTAPRATSSAPRPTSRPNGFGTVLDIDAKGTWNVSRAAYLAWMRDHGGQILNISATLHYGGTPGQLHVAAAKAAVDALTRTLAVEWGPQGIRVNAIAPGPIGDTEGARRLFSGEVGVRLQRAVPLRRLGTIEDVVNLALFVLSDAAANLNGATLVTDGGLSLSGNFGIMPGAAEGP